MNRTLLRNGAMHALRVLASAVLLTVLSGCEGQIIGPPGGQPPTRASWLSYKYPPPCVDCPELRDQVEERAYYCSIGLRGGSDANGIDPVNCATNQPLTTTFNDWKDANGFLAPGAPEARAIYGNEYDLKIGRDMNCVRANGNIACYVTNYGPPPFLIAENKVNPDWVGPNNDFPGLPGAIESSIDQSQPFATVAMVYNGTAAALNPPANAVTFYVFDGAGNLFFAPALDAEGQKTNPRMCMACHGGTYDGTAHSATGAQFLPFDVKAFLHSSRTGFTLEDQEEGYRKLNVVVRDTHPAAAIADFINGTYHNAVDTVGTIADANYVPPGWAGQEQLYTSVYRQYCRMCHLSSRTPFLTFTQFQNLASLIEDKVCQSTDMPNAQVPYVTFWQNRFAQDDLRQFLYGEGLTNLHSCK